MRYFDRVLDRSNIGRGFWITFILIAVFVIGGFVIHLFYIDVIFGFTAIAIGMIGLLYEIMIRSLRKEINRIYSNFRNISEWLDLNHGFVKRMNRMHEQRFHNLDRKRIEIEKRLDKDYRSLARKIIEIENSLNATSKRILREREFLEKLEKTADAIIKERKFMLKNLFQLSERQIKTLGIIKEQGRITNKIYRNKFRVNSKTAYKELQEMVARGLIKKRGRRAGTYYILGF